MATTNIVDKDGNTISASDATVPSDRHFRGAWTLSGKTISEDLAVAKKKALRDAPAASAISSADTIAKLKAAWDTSVLGDSPYA